MSNFHYASADGQSTHDLDELVRMYMRPMSMHLHG